MAWKRRAPVQTLMTRPAKMSRYISQPSRPYNDYKNSVVYRRRYLKKKPQIPKKLQVYESVLGPTGNISIVTKTGFVWMLNAYTLGNGNTCRHGSRSITRAVMFRFVFSAVDAFWKGHYRVKFSNFLIYDKEPGDKAPACSDIFNTAYDGSSKMVSLTANDRFKIWKRWEVNLASNSCTQGESLSAAAIGSPSKTTVEFNKYIKCLAVTDWKDVPTATIADMKRGALYFATMTDWDDQQVMVGFRGTYRSYFSSY
uniref:Capsid protein n=1 Tax=Common bean curly stunt virus TaxID=2600315 RepID=A0A5B8NEV1_9GEMI|nr:coat protein [Common bean curly stunt virus]